MLANHFHLVLDPQRLRVIYRYSVDIVPLRADLLRQPGGGPPLPAVKARALKIEFGRQVVRVWAESKGLLLHKYAFDGRHILLTSEPLAPGMGEDVVVLGRSRFQVGEVGV